MRLFGWLDLRTLVACQVPLAAVFALALYAVRRIYPHLRGVDVLGAGFALWIPATAFLVAQGTIPGFASVIGGNLLTIGCYLLLYRGLLVFLESKGMLPIVYDVASVAAAVIVYFTVVYDVAFPRIAALSIVIALVRGLIAVELLSKARARMTVFLFSGFLILFTVLPVSVALLSLVHTSLIPHAGLEAFNSISNLVFLSGAGVFSLTLYLDEASQTTENSGQFDYLTGSLNRRAIEEALTVEISRSSRTHSPVSVMMIEIDYLTALTGIHGRARMDQTLCSVVATIGNMLRFYDKCGRLADDRFLVLLPENVAEHALVIAARFRDALKSSSMPHDQPAITLSIGVTQSAFKEFPADVLVRAERALIEARNHGRDCAQIAYDEHQHMPLTTPKRSPMDRLTSGAHVAVKAVR